MNKLVTIVFDIITVVPCSVIAVLDYNNGKSFRENLKAVMAKDVELNKNPTHKP